MEDISLMQMNRDECLKLPSLNLGEVLRCHVDEGIEDVEKHLVSGAHDLLVGASIGEDYLGVSSPDKLNSKDPNLKESPQACEMYNIILYSMLSEAAS